MKTKISMNNNFDKTLKEGFEKFIQRKMVLNLSKETIIYYNDCFKYFTEFINKETLCKEITTDTIFDYISYLKANRPNLSDTTINTYLRGIRAILYFFMECDYMPSFKVKLIKAEKKIKETYTDEELEKLLVKPNVKKCQFSEYRDWVIICYLLGTGNRLRTLCNVKIGDLDFINHEIKLKAVKNKKQYIIPLSQKLEKTLQEYIEYRGGTADDYLFCTTYGEQLSKDTITNAITKYNQRRGVAKTSIHLFRHTFAKKWILNGGDIFRLQKILGHSSIDIVKEYVNMFGVDLQKNYTEFNPLDNMDCLKSGKEKIRMNKK